MKHVYMSNVYVQIMMLEILSYCFGRLHAIYFWQRDIGCLLVPGLLLVIACVTLTNHGQVTRGSHCCNLQSLVTQPLVVALN